MAKVLVTGEVATLQSTIKFDDYKFIESSCPDSLTLKDDDDKVTFRVGTTNLGGCVSECGIVFDSKTHDENGFATFSVTIACPNGDYKEGVANYFGNSLLKLKKIEDKVPSIIAAIKAEREEVLSNITLVQ